MHFEYGSCKKNIKIQIEITKYFLSLVKCKKAVIEAVYLLECFSTLRTGLNMFTDPEMLDQFATICKGDLTRKNWK